MNETAVADTGPLLHITEIGQERQLTVFEAVIISDQVKSELERHGVFHSVEVALGNRLTVENVTQPELDAQRVALSRFKLHQADLSVAALAERLAPELVLTDDLELRKALEAQEHLAVGSVGVLVRAFKAGFLTRGDLQACLDVLFDDSTLYLSKGLRAYIQTLLNSLIK